MLTVVGILRTEFDRRIDRDRSMILGGALRVVGCWYEKQVTVLVECFVNERRRQA